MSAKPVILTVNFRTEADRRRNDALYRCPSCACAFYGDQTPPDYAEPEMLQGGRTPFYLQQGAGLSLITAPLSRVRAPVGARHLDVGCGFGFGLDFGRCARGWSGLGIDPAGLAAMGRLQLGLDIETRYLEAGESRFRGAFDVVVSSETLEHVVSPQAFVETLRDALAEDGVMILTTPDAADLAPSTPPGALIPLLSPGLHLIFQNADGLNRLLRRAGLAHVRIEKDGYSLVAYASRLPLDLEDDLRISRGRYRDYLEARAENFPPGGDLHLAFAGRAFQEAVNDGVFEQARRVRQRLDAACRSRFGSDLEGLGEAARMGAPPSSLEVLAARRPVALGGLLYADVMWRLGSGEPRAAQSANLLRSKAASQALKSALNALAMEDGMTEDLLWAADAELLLSYAAAGREDIVSLVAALPPAPVPTSGSARRQEIVARVFTELVNAGRYGLAAALSHAETLDGASWARPGGLRRLSPGQRDALFALAVLGVQSNVRASLERSLARFRRLKGLLAGEGCVPEGLAEAVILGEVTALRKLRRFGRANRLAVGVALPKADA